MPIYVDPTPEQLAVIGHDPSCHGRVLAGPGTGKSWTCVMLLKHLAETRQDISVRMLTFTRAATAELVKKFARANMETPPPSTIHAFALSLLLKNAVRTHLPQPLRMPDSWEAKKLIRPDIARRLRKLGYPANAPKVAQLEKELAARWESLDETVQLLADIDPQLRSAYIGVWDHHRRTFGYTLLAELPLRAGYLLEDHEPHIDQLDLLIVDEFQDLNKADIKLIHLMAQRGMRVLAIGDNDQSIYGFRMAAPAGILNFHHEFENCRDYALTLSQRCGSELLAAATMLIEAAPERPRKPSLTFSRGTKPGRYLYLRFPDETAEAEGVARLIEMRIQAGIPSTDIAVLVRSQRRTWAKQLIPILAKRNIVLEDVNWVEDVLEEPEVRRGLALIHLALQRDDSLAWWTILADVSKQFLDYIYQEAADARQSFGQTLLRLYPEFPRAPTPQSAKTVSKLMTSTLSVVDTMKIEGVELDETGWGGWIIQQVNPAQLSSQALRLFKQAGQSVPISAGLGYFLGQLEPLGKDLAAQSDAVRLMSMAASKGLTVNTCIIMGVEQGLIPHPKAPVEEDRRLLYVAMTRATDMCVLTWAQRRTGQTAHHGEPNVYKTRSRCTLLEDLPIGRWKDGQHVLKQLESEV